MSLILEALKRSEAERRLGEAPDLLAAPPEFVTAPPSRTPSVALWVGTAALLVVGLIFAGWSFTHRGANGASAPVAATPAVVPPDLSIGHSRRGAAAVDGTPVLLGVPLNPTPPSPPPAPPSIATPGVAPDPTAPLLPPDTVVGRSPVTVEAQPPPVAEPLAGSAAPPSSGDPAVAVKPMDSTSGVVDPTAASTLPANTAVRPGQGVAAAAFPPEPMSPAVEEPPASGLPDLSDLPLAVRQSLPPLVLNMHLYRAIPGERVVILDGKRLREGESVGELQVAEIRSDGVVLVAQGQRFLLSRLPR